MNDFVANAFEDADVLLFVTDKFQKEEEQNTLLTCFKKQYTDPDFAE